MQIGERHRCNRFHPIIMIVRVCRSGGSQLERINRVARM